MARHKPRWLCTVCGRRRVPFKGCVCRPCSLRIPGLPEWPPTHPSVHPAANVGTGGAR
jgi:hypothetical protein